jgi:hypothetical protein
MEWKGFAKICNSGRLLSKAIGRGNSNTSTKICSLIRNEKNIQAENMINLMLLKYCSATN